MPYQVTSLGISVLALLRQQPMHGYEMFQTLVARHEDRILKVRPGSLYHAVNRLAEEKLIRTASTGRAGNRPERTIYEITDAGADVLTERLGELLAGPVNEFEKFVVALTEIHQLSPPFAVSALQRRVAALEATAAELSSLRELASGQPGQRLGLDYLLATTTAKATWVRELMHNLAPVHAETTGAAS